jgi:hypothetical protein
VASARLYFAQIAPLPPFFYPSLLLWLPFVVQIALDSLQQLPTADSVSEERMFGAFVLHHLRKRADPIKKHCIVHSLGGWPHERQQQKKSASVLFSIFLAALSARLRRFTPVGMHTF